MHIPDGFLSPPVFAATGLLAAAGVGAALRAGGRALRDRDVPLLGVTGAFVFAAQMVNVPVGVGTSGHLVGGALLTALVGPHLAAVTLTAVLVVQCLLFQDGGLTALGANVLDMALAGPYVAWLVYRVAGERPWTRFAAGWLSLLVAAALASVEIGLSGTAPLGPVLAAMLGVHAVIGILEGVLTAVVARFVADARADAPAAGREGT